MTKKLEDSWSFEEATVLERLHKDGLRVGVMAQPPWAYDCALGPSALDGKACGFPGMGIEFTRTLCDRIQLRCHFMPANYSSDVAVDGDVVMGDAGTQKIVSQIVYDELDTTLPLVEESIRSRDFLDFTMPLFFLDPAFLVRTRITHSSDLFYVLKPFSAPVWISILFSLCSVALVDASFVILLNHRHSPDAWRRRLLGQSLHSWMTSLGLMVQRSSEFRGTEDARRLLFFCWGVSSILICGIYSAFLVSRKVATTLHLPFTDLHGLATALSRGECTLIIDQYTGNFLRQIQTARKDSDRYEDLRVAFAKNPPRYVANYSGLVALIAKSEKAVVFYSSRYTLMALARENCNVTVVPLSHKPIRGSFPFRKTTPYSKIFNKLILNFKDKGYYLEHLEKKYRFGRQCDVDRGIVGAPPEGSTAQVYIKASSLRGLFLFVGLGLCVGCVGLCVELAVARLRKPRLRFLLRQSAPILAVAAARAQPTLRPHWRRRAKMSRRGTIRRTDFQSIFTYNDGRNGNGSSPSGNRRMSF